jgi:hypothetical protein
MKTDSRNPILVEVSLVHHGTTQNAGYCGIYEHCMTRVLDAYIHSAAQTYHFHLEK